MARLILFAPCQVAIIDSASSGVSLVNVVESFGLPQLPAPIPPLFLVAAWRRNEDEVDSAMLQRIELRAPDNSIVARIDTPFLFDKIGHRIVNFMANAPLEQSGKYEFCVYITRQNAEFPEQPAGSFPLLVAQIPNLQIAPIR